jgi:uncharacterized protein YjiS (DUF1127 family)
MSSGAADFEALLREAFAPVEPSPDLANRLEMTLVNLTELAHDELEAWELSAMRNPRNWGRPLAAAMIGATAGTALVVLRVRSHHRARKQESKNLLQLAEHTLHDIGEEARRILPLH